MQPRLTHCFHVLTEWWRGVTRGKYKWDKASAWVSKCVWNRSSSNFQNVTQPKSQLLEPTGYSQLIHSANLIFPLQSPTQTRENHRYGASRRSPLLELPFGAAAQHFQSRVLIWMAADAGVDVVRMLRFWTCHDRDYSDAAEEAGWAGYAGIHMLYRWTQMLVHGGAAN